MTRRSDKAARTGRRRAAALLVARRRAEDNSAASRGSTSAVALEDDDTLGLSFLDVLCCGLGGAICLFLIFSVLEHAGIVGATSTREQMLGADASTPVTGANYKDLKEVVRNAVFMCEVKFTRTEASAPPIPREAVGFKRPPRGMDEAFATVPDGSFHRFVAIKPGGVSPNTPLAFEIRGPIEDLASYECEVTVGSGSGELAERREIQLPDAVEVSDAVVLFRIDLLDRDKDGSWILEGEL